MRPGIMDGGQLPVQAPVAKPTGDQYTLGACQQLSGVVLCDRLRIHILDMHLGILADAPMAQGFCDA